MEVLQQWRPLVSSSQAEQPAGIGRHMPAAHRTPRDAAPHAPLVFKSPQVEGRWEADKGLSPVGASGRLAPSTQRRLDGSYVPEPCNCYPKLLLLF
uniref:Uncharacterized protein n=1 Tax=Neogobius melanostomus TaxID=47308 RepID=A0A8C6U9J3_9GOBI